MIGQYPGDRSRPAVPDPLARLGIEAAKLLLEAGGVVADDDQTLRPRPAFHREQGADCPSVKSITGEPPDPFGGVQHNTPLHQRPPGQAQMPVAHRPRSDCSLAFCACTASRLPARSAVSRSAMAGSANAII
jgi:hypothetical protein